MAIQLVQTQRPMMQQRMILAPQVIQSIEILQLPLLQLQERIDQELLENPMLEVEEPEGAEESERPDSLEDRKQDEILLEGEDFAKLDNLSDDFREYFYQASSPQPPAGEKDEKMEALANSPDRPPSLPDYLLEQLRFLNVEDDLREIVEYLVQNLRRDGYLNGTLEEIVAGMERPVSSEQAEAALRTLQSLDPPGVGARDLRECLLIQLSAADVGEESLVARIVRDHLEDIHMNRYPKVAHALGADIEEIKEAVEQIKQLNPRPGEFYDPEVAPYVSPDILVEYIDGRYEVSLNESSVPHLRVSAAYREMVRNDSDKEAREYIRQKTDTARWFIDSIEQRRHTLLRISEEIVRSQEEFFEYGLGHLKPLKMQEVADAVGVHVTTVSRAIRNKYAQTPRGVFPLKFFFSGGVTTSQGESESFNAVKQRIADLVESEDKSAPYSDDKIMNVLKEQGVDIARRTVTKYRKALGIPSSRQRKEY